MDSFYYSWNSTCERIANNKEISWKRDNVVGGMLEHVHGDYANIYLDLIIENKLSLNNIQKYTDMVDAIGEPGRDTYNRKIGKIISSTTCLRYLHQAMEIIKLIKLLKGDEKNYPSLVEIGGGYGGLAVAINYLLQLENSNIKLNYVIIDLPSVLKLQSYYTSQFSLTNISITFLNGENYGKDLNLSNMYIISNYCLAEMGHENRANYVKNIFGKTKQIVGGYLQWNSGAPYDFLNLFDCDIQDERPQTGPDNKTIIFTKKN
jgi:hypothetical protein